MSGKDSTSGGGGANNGGGDLGGGDKASNDDQTKTSIPSDSIEVKSFIDLMVKSVDFDHFLRLFAKNWWTMFVWFNFW
jgi:hypothetical protein